MHKLKVMFLLTGFTALFACEPETKQQDEAYERLLEVNQEQRVAANEKDSTVNDIMAAFNDIYVDLRRIKEKETGLKLNDTDVELQNGTHEKIVDELKAIDALMSTSREKIAALRNNLKKSELNMAEMVEAIENLNLMLEERDEEIALLEDELMSTSKTLGTLIQMYRDQSQMVDFQEDELNTAYYIFGTNKQLKEQGILTKEGGFAGIGGKQRLSGDIDLDAFKKIDITKDTEIVLKAKGPKILSTHPTGSYEWVEHNERLMITDTEKFWSLSKYLVISVQ